MSVRKPSFVLLTSFLLGTSPTTRGAVPAQPPTADGLVGRSIGEFERRDCLGAVRKLSDFKHSPVVVVAFLGVDCPLVKLYGPKLAEMAAEFQGRGVAFLGVNSNAKDALTQAAAFARRSGVQFPVLMDPQGGLADLFGATRTPEVFVLDAERKVRYHGRIDDQYGVGFQRKAPRRRDLALAVGELLDGRPVAVASTEPAGCLIGRTLKVNPRGNVTYSQQVSRILAKRCMECHRIGEAAPFPLTTYEETVGWAPMIREVVEEGRMPPWFADPKHGRFRNDCRLAEEERTTLTKWIDDGAPEGDRSQLPDPPQFATGWRIPRPDRIVYMSETPAKIRAHGAEGYKSFVVDPHFEKDVWVQAAEARPGNRAVVHHHLAYFVAPFGNETVSQILCQIAGYAPGTPPPVYPPGTAVRIPARSKIHFQMHYTPIGVEQTDRSSLGLVFADPKSVRFEVRNQMAINFRLKIPAGEPNYTAEAKYVFPREATLINLAPHMHYRGKSFVFELVRPGGRREVLLDVPRYDFNWQLRYDLAQPIRVPEGSWIHCRAAFDNSEDNPANPDPTKVVRFGEQTWEEMMVGVFQTIEPRGSSGPASKDDLSKR